MTGALWTDVPENPLAGWSKEKPRYDVTEAADLLDAVADVVSSAAGVAGRSERNRLSMLYVHALFAFIIAPLFGLWGSSPVGMSGNTWVLLRTVPGAASWMAGLLFAGGAVLFLATAARAPRWASVGLGLIMTWYSIIAVGFLGAVVIWVADGSPPQETPAVYAWGVYGHLAAIMIIHLITTWRLLHPTGAGDRR